MIPTRPARNWATLVLVIVAVFVADRSTKYAASALLAGEPARSYFANTVRLEYAENTGGFLSLGAGLPPRLRTATFTITTGAVLLLLMVLVMRRRPEGLEALAFALFFTGGLSNWIDRVARGSVVDFLNVGIGALRTGIFNIADMAILAGGALLIYDVFRKRRQPETAPSSSNS